MTDQEVTKVTPEEKDAEKEQQAAEAFDRIRTGQHWRDWTFVAEGLATGRRYAYRMSGTQRPFGRGYTTAFSEWMDRQPGKWPRKLDKATMAHCFWVNENLTAIEGWRENLRMMGQQAKLDRMNHPSTMKRAYEADDRNKKAKAGDKTALTPMARKQVEIEELTEVNRNLTNKVHDLEWQLGKEGGGNVFNQGVGKPEAAVRALIENMAGDARLKDWTIQFFRIGGREIDRVLKKKTVG